MNQSRLPLDYVRQTPAIVAKKKEIRIKESNHLELKKDFAARMHGYFKPLWGDIRAVGDKIGLSPKQSGLLFGGSSLPTYETLANFPAKLNLNWLVRGTGSPVVGFELVLPDDLRDKLEKRAGEARHSLETEILELVEKQLKIIEIVEG